MNAAEFKTLIDKPLPWTTEQQLAIFHRVLGWLSADVSDGKGEQRLRLMIATQIRTAIRKELEVA